MTDFTFLYQLFKIKCTCLWNPCANAHSATCDRQLPHDCRALHRSGHLPKLNSNIIPFMKYFLDSLGTFLPLVCHSLFANLLLSQNLHISLPAFFHSLQCYKFQGGDNGHDHYILRA